MDFVIIESILRPQMIKEWICNEKSVTELCVCYIIICHLTAEFNRHIVSSQWQPDAKKVAAPPSG